jgi:hypothetical protein
MVGDMLAHLKIEFASTPPPPPKPAPPTPH